MAFDLQTPLDAEIDKLVVQLVQYLLLSNESFLLFMHLCGKLG